MSYADFERNFDVIVSFRLTPAQVEAVKQEVKRHCDVYENVSHYVRVAVLKQLRGVR